MKVVFGGDFFPGFRWEKQILDNSHDIWSDEVKDFMFDADLKIVNLETPLTDSISPIKKIGPNLKSSPKTVKSLLSGGVNLVTLANNHIYDYGEEGLNDTLNHLKKNNINYIGVGENEVNASDSHFLQDDVVFLNYGNNEWGTASSQAGGYNGYSLIDIHTKIKEISAKGYFICLILHSGHELYKLPSPQMVKEFRFFVDQGADLIITHHSHYHSGYEKYKGGHIFYGLGNLLFDSISKNKNWFHSFLLKIEIINKKIKKIDFLPIRNKVNEGKILRLSKKEESSFYKNLTSLNKTIKCPEQINKEWKKHVAYMKSSYMVGLKNYIKYYIALGNRIPILNKWLFRSTDHNRKLMNYFLCESHSEVIKTFIKDIK
jgi:poly-gamma-glutamate capsule biosynthesis protein CapA/YwtB (metallophosphatase superfamily)